MMTKQIWLKNNMTKFKKINLHCMWIKIEFQKYIELQNIKGYNKKL